MAQLKQDPNKRHYFTEVNPSEVLEVLRKAIEDKVEVRLWREGNSEKEVEIYLPVEVDEKTLMTSLEPQGGLLSKLFSSKLLGSCVFYKVGSDKFQFFGTADFLQDKNSKKFLLKFNSPLFKTQQRTNYRLQASSSVRIQFRVSEEVLHDAIDISAGGTSFIIKKDLQEDYPKDKKFKDCRIGLNTQKFDIPTAIVAGQWAVTPKPGEEMEYVKVGMAFSDLSQEHEGELFKAINSEARAEEMRKALLERKQKQEDS